MYHPMARDQKLGDCPVPGLASYVVDPVLVPRMIEKSGAFILRMRVDIPELPHDVRESGVSLCMTAYSA